MSIICILNLFSVGTRFIKSVKPGEATCIPEAPSTTLLTKPKALERRMQEIEVSNRQTPRSIAPSGGSTGSPQRPTPTRSSLYGTPVSLQVTRSNFGTPATPLRKTSDVEYVSVVPSPLPDTGSPRLNKMASDQLPAWTDQLRHVYICLIDIFDY